MSKGLDTRNLGTPVVWVHYLYFFLTPSVLRLALFSAVTPKEFQETLLRAHKNFDVPSKHHPDCFSLHCIVSLLD